MLQQYKSNIPSSVIELIEILEKGPAWLPAKRGQHRASVKYTSYKMGKLLDVDGSGCTLLCKAAEFDTRVIKIYPEPFVLDLETGNIAENKEALLKKHYTHSNINKLRTYKPDLAVLFDNYEIHIFEYKKIKNYDANDPRLLRATELLSYGDFHFKIALDTEFKDIILPENIDLLYKYKNPNSDTSIQPLEKKQLECLFDKFKDPVSLEDACAHLKCDVKSLIKSLLTCDLSADMRCDLSNPLAKIFYPGEEMLELKVLP